MNAKRIVIFVVAGTLVLCAGMVGVVVTLVKKGPFGEDSTVTPRAGQCRTLDTAGVLGGFPVNFEGRVVDCGTSHVLETIFVGRASGRLIDPETRKEIGQTCAEKAEKFLGAKHQAGRIGLTFYMEEKVGAEDERWYSCDLAEFGSALQFELLRRSSSLRGSLSGAATMALGCVEQDDQDYSYLPDCARPHGFEFAGLYTLPADVFPVDSDARDEAVLPGCTKTVTDYLGWDQQRYEDDEVIDVTYWGPTPTDIRGGSRVFQCYVATLDDKKLTGSVKGLGEKKAPVVG